MDLQPHLSVVVPSYNEERNLSRGVLDDIATYLGNQDYTWEVILSDDGSSDATPQLLEAFAKTHPGFRVQHNSHGGKASTVTAGMLAAKGKFRLFTDFDQSTPLSEVEKFWPFVSDGYDIVIGSREVQGAHREKEPLLRHVMGKGFNVLVQALAVPGIFDTQCGFKLFSEAATKALFAHLVIYAPRERQDAFTGAFDVELLLLARRWKYQIAEVPVLWKHNFTDRVSPLRDSIRMFFDILRIRMAAWQNRYPKRPA